MKDITPEGHRCGMVEECPAVFRLEDGQILLIGKKVEAATLSELTGRSIGADECAVMIDPGLLENVVFDK